MIGAILSCCVCRQPQISLSRARTDHDRPLVVSAVSPTWLNSSTNVSPHLLRLSLSENTADRIDA